MPGLVLNTAPKNERTCVVIPASGTKRLESILVNKYLFVLHQIRAMDQRRFIRKVERLNEGEVQQVIDIFVAFLGK